MVGTSFFAKMALALFLVGGGLWAQCVEPSNNQWSFVDVIAQNSGDLSHPTNFDVLSDGRMFISEMWTGKIKYYEPGQGVSDLGGPSDVYVDRNAPIGIENGMLGVAADPNFDENNRIYVLYSRQTGNQTYSFGDGNVLPHDHVLARFTVANGQLTQQKDILVFERQSARHSAGGLEFDPTTGDLYITTGDDTHPGNVLAHFGPRQENSPQWNSLRTSGNTNDLRGKVLRIRPIDFPNSQTPTPGEGTTYSVPPGNMVESFGQLWGDQDLPLIRPEIYTMGHRNPYHIKYDPITGLGMIGEVGPDAGSDNQSLGIRGHDEFNLIEGPGNYGWPFANADNQAYTAGSGEAYTEGTTFNLNSLQNISTLNTGANALPPAIPAFGYYSADGNQTGLHTDFGGGGESAIAGRLYHYDPNGTESARLPAFFNGKFVVADWVRGRMWSLELNSDHELEAIEEMHSGLSKIIDLEYDGDGVFYGLIYGNNSGYHGDVNTGRVFRMEYTGTHYAATACNHYIPPNKPVSVSQHFNAQSLNKSVMFANLDPSSFISVPSNATKLEVYGLNGMLLGVVGELQGKSQVQLAEHLSGKGPVYLKFQ